jgi:hypothetical protein
VTSSIAAFEIPKQVANQPPFDGFIDRVAFGDYCGNLYELDPAQELAATSTVDDPVWGPTIEWLADEGWIDSSTVSTNYDTGTDDDAGQSVYALFSVKDDWSADATGHVDDDAQTAIGAGAAADRERPIAGTLGVRQRSNNSVFIFFGTGGIETFDGAKRNAMFAVNAEDGKVRDALAGACTEDDPIQCQKYYGGIVVTNEQVIYTRSYDPIPGNEECTFGDSELVGAMAGDLTASAFDTINLGKATVSALSSDKGAVYGTTLGGVAFRAGTPSAFEGGESGDGDDGSINVNASFRTLYWDEN